jgi:hypothetical protein
MADGSPTTAEYGHRICRASPIDSAGTIKAPAIVLPAKETTTDQNRFVF